MNKIYDVYLCRRSIDEFRINLIPKHLQHGTSSQKKHNEWLASQMLACQPLDFSDRNRNDMMNSVNLSCELVKLPEIKQSKPASLLYKAGVLAVSFWAAMSFCWLVFYIIIQINKAP
jgi:hypothetical protein